MRRRRTLLLAVLALALLAPAGVTPSDTAVVTDDGHPAGVSAPGGTVPTDATPKILTDVEFRAGSATTRLRRPRLTVVVEAREGRGDEVARAVAERGQVQTRADESVQARLSGPAVRALAERPAVAHIRSPTRVQRVEHSTGLDEMNATRSHANGHTGENVTVAVVDTGFDANNPEIADNVVRVKDFTGSGFRNQSGQHGTAVAELLVDTAPNVSLVLVRVSTATEFRAAANWVDESTNADIASASIGVPTGPFDGTSPLSREIGQGVERGTAWFLAAGNAARGGHLNTTWRDADGDGNIDWVAGDELLHLTVPETGYPVGVVVNWNRWQTTDENYDVYLYGYDNASDSLELVAASTNQQSGSQPPFERVVAKGYRHYFLRIHRADASGNAEFTLFTANDGTVIREHADAAQSLKRPAATERALTVGAVNDATVNLEPYSSRGPTIDGRLKPDLVAPDRVPTTALGSFAGTSAAAPHAAGVGALVLDAANGDVPPARLNEILRASASGPWPVDNRTGYGLVDARAAIDRLNTTNRTTERLPLERPGY